MGPRLQEIEELQAEITLLAAHISAATYRFLVLLAELDRKVSWAGEGIASAAHWLNYRCGISLRAAQEQVRVAYALPALAKISAAFERGEVSYSKVRAMTRVATAANEDYLLNFARSGTAWHVEKLVRSYRTAERGRETAAARRQFAERELSWSYDSDGSLVFRGRLPAELGGMVVAALEAAREELFRKQRDEADGKPVDERPAEREADTAQREGGAAATPAMRPPWIPEDHEGPQAKRADALVFLAESFLANGGAALAAGERYLLHVHVDESALPRDGDGTRCHVDDGPALAAETVRRLACDCGRVCLHDDEHGEVLSVGRKTRQIPPAIRRALRSRDGGCQFPGCINRRFVDGHHIEHWADGGDTSLANLVMLCRFHHRLVHEGGYAVEASEGGFEFRDPSGRVLRCRPAVIEGDSVAAIVNRNLGAGLAIDAETIRPHGWYGEPVIWSWAVESLAERDHRPHA